MADHDPSAAAADAWREGPSWLPHFLSGNYFSHCAKHISTKNERNHFCIDCVVDGPMCHIGLHNEHAQHRSLQVRRASHMDAVRVHDIAKLADVSGIQTYTINGAKIVFLLSRPQEKVAKAAMHWCLSCNRTLTDPTSFCSISCKLAVVRSPHHPSVSLALPSDGDEQVVDHRLPLHASAAAAAAVVAKSGPGTCCFENEALFVKSSAEVLTDEQKLAKGGRKAQLPLKKRKIDQQQQLQQSSRPRIFTESDDDVDDFMAPCSPISVLLPHSPQHSGNSHYCLTYVGGASSSGAENVAPSTPQKNSEASLFRIRQRRKGLPQRSPLV